MHVVVSLSWSMGTIDPMVNCVYDAGSCSRRWQGMMLPNRDPRPSSYQSSASRAIRRTVRLASGCSGNFPSPKQSPRFASRPRMRPRDSPPPEPTWTRSRCSKPCFGSRRPCNVVNVETAAFHEEFFRTRTPTISVRSCERQSGPAASFPRSITSDAAAASRLSAGDGCAHPAVECTAHPQHPCGGARRPGHHRESLVPKRVEDRGPPDDHHSLRARRGDRPAAGAAARGLVVCRVAPADCGSLVRNHPRCAPGTAPVARLGMCDAEAFARGASSALCRDGPSSPHMRRPRPLGDERLILGRTRPGTNLATSTIRTR